MEGNSPGRDEGGLCRRPCPQPVCLCPQGSARRCGRSMRSRELAGHGRSAIDTGSKDESARAPPVEPPDRVSVEEHSCPIDVITRFPSPSGRQGGSNSATSCVAVLCDFPTSWLWPSGTKGTVSPAST